MSSVQTVTHVSGSDKVRMVELNTADMNQVFQTLADWDTALKLQFDVHEHASPLILPDEPNP